jgi:hypothetical protein
MSTIYSIGQMNQLADAFEAAGYTPDDVTKLRSKPKTLKQFKSVLMGTAEVVIKTHAIDCDVNPYVPNGWKVEEHIKGGKLRWNPDEVELWLADEQKGGVIEGNKLRKLLKGKPVLNACVLDYLLANPHLIPEEWKSKYVFFWGTIYRHSDGDLCVRCLGWDGDGWDWSSHWLVSNFSGNSPAVLSCK